MLRCKEWATVLRMVALFVGKGKMVSYREANEHDGFEGWVVFVG